jgi:hypothetical protein
MQKRFSRSHLKGKKLGVNVPPAIPEMMGNAK